jgi:hypothetical protein
MQNFYAEVLSPAKAAEAAQRHSSLGAAIEEGLQRACFSTPCGLWTGPDGG